MTSLPYPYNEGIFFNLGLAKKMTQGTQPNREGTSKAALRRRMPSGGVSIERSEERGELQADFSKFAHNGNSYSSTALVEPR